MVVHSAAQYELFTGRIVPGYPSMGCWVTYGLGFGKRVTSGLRRDAGSQRRSEGGQPMYANGFLPANFQPTHFRPGNRPVLNLSLPEGVRSSSAAARSNLFAI